jgi:3-keto-5-aminohexanoate cleavage enzyme
MHDPLTTVEGLSQSVKAIRRVTPDGIIQVCSAGRASSYLASAGMLLGVESVRVGMEDTIYRWPHRDDKIKSNAEVVRDMVNLAKILGREVSSANEMRDLLKINQKNKMKF